MGVCSISPAVFGNMPMTDLSKARESHFTVDAAIVTAASLRPYLEQCGYQGSRLATDYSFDGETAPLVGFFGRPWDARSACVAAVDSKGDTRASAATCYTLGTPTVFVCRGDGFDCWTISGDGPAQNKPIDAQEIRGFFQTHADDLSPETIYAAKTRRPVAAQRQLWFVDVGLMPAVERRMGQALHRLVEGAIQDLSAELGGQLRSRKALTDLYKTVFWLLAAKLLNEKDVENFKRIDLKNVDEVFDRVGRHYADTATLPPGGKKWRAAIDAVAANIASWGNLGNISPEALGYLYEQALVDKKPKGARAKKIPKGRDIRRELGIHSTPPVLVDHMLAQLWTLIEQIPPVDRRVFEPACGHGAFLVAALRWLREYSGVQEGIDRHRYLRDRLYGVEVDSFARELCKLSLTLADVPHRNSWRIDQNDMFAPSVLKNAAAQCTVLLANPPYERFRVTDKNRYQKAGEPVTAITKAVEMLKRTLPHLPPGGVFGVVMPQGVLHDKESIEMRRLLLTEFELSEISLFADNLFEESDHEVAVLMGRRRKPTASSTLMYRRVRERGMAAFKERLTFSSVQVVDQACFAASATAELRVAELDAVWKRLAECPLLKSVAILGQGLTYKGRGLPTNTWTIHKPPRKGDARGFKGVPSDLAIYGEPPLVGMNLDRSVLLHVRTGLPSGRPQVLVNYAPVSREAWRLKAVLDPNGRAISSRYINVRPRPAAPSCMALWALLNSPVANAFAYCHLMKRDILVGTIRKLPIPTLNPGRFRAVEAAASAYLQLARKEGGFMSVGETESEVRAALVRMDAEVLRLYDLPPRLERQLLDLFEGVERKGVGCEFKGYYQSGLDAFVPLHELISDEYARSTMEEFRQQRPLDSSSPVLAALRSASEAFAEE